MVHEQFFKKIIYADGNEIDVAALEKRIEEQIKEAPWRTILKPIVKQCVE